MELTWSQTCRGRTRRHAIALRGLLAFRRLLLAQLEHVYAELDLRRQKTTFALQSSPAKSFTYKGNNTFTLQLSPEKSCCLL